MALHHVGKKVKVTQSVPALRKGDEARVTSIHHEGPFYGLAVGGGVTYVPQNALDPDHDGDIDTPGQPDYDAPGTTTSYLPGATAAAEALLARLSPETKRRILNELRAANRGA